VASFAGVANPFLAGRLPPGATVVDIGSGAGTDSMLAALYVGPSGRVIGVDPTDAMLDKARASAAKAGLANLELRKGRAEELPVESASVDVVISNGVINLCPDKYRVLAEIFRTLKPAGRLYLADVVVHKAVPDAAKANVALWTA
jgi:ubiquinone/menaquinone biosynthesis C-methylase UbiE